MGLVILNCVFFCHQIAFRVWMIDSGMLDCNGGFEHFGCIHKSQLDWYLKQDHTIPGIIYMHIPPKELIHGKMLTSKIQI